MYGILTIYEAMLSAGNFIAKWTDNENFLSK